MNKFIKILILLELIQINEFTFLDFGDSKAEKICQSGLREDNTNYIYCARQNLSKIPNFLNSKVTNENLASNIIYDELVLSDNEISFIDSDSLNLKVKKLYLDSNPIRFIDHGAFEHIRNYLEELYFDFKTQDTVLTYQDDSLIFEQSIFQTCFNLHVLSIKSYRINELRGFKLQRLSKIETLTLSNVNLKSIHKDAFIGLEKSLIELNLDSNLLEKIPSESIEVLKRLKRLNLSQNRIKNLEANAFFRFSSSFNTLDLSYNYLRNVDQNAFSGPIQNSLRTLQLQNNELKWPNFINLLFNLHQLQELNIDFNKLSNSIVKSTRFTGLSSNNSIYLKLTSLSMQGNGLTEQSLNLLMDFYDYDSVSQNDYLRLKKFKYTSLAKLNLARNKIKRVSINFFKNLNMSNLRQLNLDRNPLNASLFDLKTFSGAEESLRSLSINSAGLGLVSQRFVDALNFLRNLEILKLNGNSLQLIDAFLGLKIDTLVSLELQNNNLNQIPNVLCNFKNLTDLDLSSNRLTALNLNCLSKSKLKQLNLNNNPLKCDCSLRELKIWLKLNYDKDLLELIKWNCNEPSSLSSRDFADVRIDELRCKDEPALKSADPVVIVQNSEPSTINTINTRYTQTSTFITFKTIATSSNLPVSNSQPLNEKFRLIASPVSNQSDLSLNYFSLIIGISLGVSLVCLIVLIVFYACCIRAESNIGKKSNSFFYGTGSDKYEHKNFCSPQSSVSTSSTSSSSASSTRNKNSSDLVQIFSNEYLGSVFNQESGMIMSKGSMIIPSVNQNYYDKPNCYHQINVKHELDYNNLNYASSVYSISTNETNVNESHIYHEISANPSQRYLPVEGAKVSFGRHANNNHQIPMQSNLNGEINCNFNKYNSLHHFNANENLNFCNKINNFHNSLIV